MKKFLDKLNEFQKMLLLAGVISLFLILLSLIPIFVAKQFGWLIGVAIGSTVELASIFLLYKGSEMTISSMKALLFVVFYLLRMTLLFGGMVVAAILQFGFAFTSLEPNPFFNYTFWGEIIGFAPMQIIIILVMLIKKKGPLTISEKKDNE